jgi:hypothetical protein
VIAASRACVSVESNHGFKIVHERTTLGRLHDLASESRSELLQRLASDPDDSLG